MKTTEPKPNYDVTAFDIVALISTPFATAIIIACFYANSIYLILGFRFIIPFLLLYAISFFGTLFMALIHWKRAGLISKTFHLIVILIWINLWLGNSEVFKSEKTMTAVLRDDLFHFTLVLRKDGTCETETNGMLGFSETSSGYYLLKGDTVIFKKVPYEDRSLIPDTVLIDRGAKAIFIKKEKNGGFDKRKAWLSYFEIED